MYSGRGQCVRADNSGATVHELDCEPEDEECKDSSYAVGDMEPKSGHSPWPTHTSGQELPTWTSHMEHPPPIGAKTIGDARLKAINTDCRVLRTSRSWTESSMT